jgi:hypothetical protein
MWFLGNVGREVGILRKPMREDLHPELAIQEAIPVFVCQVNPPLSYVY